jgi:hypothetical protein
MRSKRRGISPASPEAGAFANALAPMGKSDHISVGNSLGPRDSQAEAAALLGPFTPE